MPLPKRLFLFATVSLALAQTCAGQGASSWRAFKTVDGLPRSACVSVAVCPNGTVLAKLMDRSGVVELDGFGVNVIPLPEPLGSDIAESPGGQPWIMVQDGLREFKNGAWVPHSLPEIAAEFRAGNARWSSSSLSLHPVRQGRVRVLFADRLLEFNLADAAHPASEVLLTTSQTRLGKFSDLTVGRDGGTWVAAEQGLAKIAKSGQKPESEWAEYLLPESLALHNLRAPREDAAGGITVVGEPLAGEGTAAVWFDGKTWTTFFAGAGELRCAWMDLNQTAWVMSTDLLLQKTRDRAEFVDNPEISVRQFYDAALEPGGSFWLATSEGLLRYAPPIWQTPASVEPISAPVQGLTEDATGRLWFVCAGMLESLKDDRHQEYALPAAARAGGAILPLKDGALLLESGQWPVRFEPDTGKFKPISIRSDVRQVKPLGLLKDGTVCLQSVTGLPPGRFYFDRFDGVQIQPLADPPPDSNFPGGFSTLLAARNGDLWLGGEQGGLAWFHEGKWRAYPASDAGIPDALACFVELPDGRIWGATRSKIWEFDGKSWISVRSGFDHINAVLSARDGGVWVADDGGLQRYAQNAWLENGREEGLPGAAVRGVIEDQRGRIWAGTTRGLSLYHPEADPDPPRTFLETPGGQAMKARAGGAITLAFGGRDKWKFTPRERLLFSYRLDERDWSAFQAGDSVTFSDLPAGKHYFQVRAMDRNGNVDPKPSLLDFSVVLPWYKDFRLVLIALAGAGAALFFAALAVNRHRRLVLSHAEVERKVAQRTRELELAHRELLHSQKMNALGTLAAGIAHDFNNILSIVKGSAQIIEDNLENQQKIRTRVDRIKTVVEQGSGIVKAMLGFSRDSDGQPAACAPNEVVADTIKLLGDRFLHEVEVRFEPAPGLPELPASKDFIQQILLNCIFNAAEAMTGQKRIVLATARLAQLPPGLVLPPAAAAEYIAISIRDCGSGISPENLPRIFEPFFTTKAFSTRRGTGLGLSMVYELAKRIEAGLAVESAVGQGSTFTLVVPVKVLAAEGKA